MKITRSSILRIVKIFVAFLMICLIILYAIWRSLNYTRGPSITIFEPSDGSNITASTTSIKGRAERINELQINGFPISTDSQGNFNETVIIFPGINFLDLYAHDQFGRHVDKQLRLLGK